MTAKAPAVVSGISRAPKMDRDRNNNAENPNVATRIPKPANRRKRATGSTVSERTLIATCSRISANLVANSSIDDEVS